MSVVLNVRALPLSHHQSGITPASLPLCPAVPARFQSKPLARAVATALFALTVSLTAGQAQKAWAGPDHEFPLDISEPTKVYGGRLVDLFGSNPNPQNNTTTSENNALLQKIVEDVQSSNALTTEQIGELQTLLEAADTGGLPRAFVTEGFYATYTYNHDDSRPQAGQDIWLRGKTAGHIHLGKNAILRITRASDTDENDPAGPPILLEKDAMLILSAEDGARYVFENLRSSQYASAVMNGGTLWINRADFLDNRAPAGGLGALWSGANANVLLQDVRFARNSSEQGGGAIFNSGNLAIEKAWFEDNTTTQNAGAIRSSTRQLKLNEVSFTGNKALSGSGGAIYLESGSLIGKAIKFANNQAGSGGAIYLNSDPMAINKGTFTENKAGDNGGAIYQSSGELTLSDSEFTGNTSENAGGAIYLESGSLIGKEIELANNQAGSGGAIYFNSGSMEINKGIFTENKAGDNGGAIYQSTGELTLSDSEFTGNTSENAGGAIYLEAGTLNINNSSFDKNKAGPTLYEHGDAWYDKGGAIYNNGGTLTVEGSTFTGNTSHWGGAIYHGSGSTTIKNSRFENNEDHDSGGGAGAIEVSGGTVEIDGAKFIGNYGQNVGAIRNTFGNLTIRNSLFKNNNSAFVGAIQLTEGGTNKLINVDFFGNSSDGVGALELAGKAEVEQVVEQNKTSVYAGNTGFWGWGYNSISFYDGSSYTLNTEANATMRMLDSMQVDGSGTATINKTGAGKWALAGENGLQKANFNVEDGIFELLAAGSEDFDHLKSDNNSTGTHSWSSGKLVFKEDGRFTLDEKAQMIINGENEISGGNVVLNGSLLFNIDKIKIKKGDTLLTLAGNSPVSLGANPPLYVNSTNGSAFAAGDQYYLISSEKGGLVGADNRTLIVNGEVAEAKRSYSDALWYKLDSGYGQGYSEFLRMMVFAQNTRGVATWNGNGDGNWSDSSWDVEMVQGQTYYNISNTITLNGDEVIFTDNSVGGIITVDDAEVKTMTVDGGDYTFTGGSIKAKDGIILKGGTTRFESLLLGDVKANAGAELTLASVIMGDATIVAGATLTLANGAYINGALTAAGEIVFEKDALATLKSADFDNAVLTINGINTLAVSDNLDLAGGITLEFDVSQTGNDQLILATSTSDLSQAKIDIKFEKAPGQSGTYKLIGGTKVSGTGTLSSVAGITEVNERTADGQSFYLKLKNINGDEVQLVAVKATDNTTVTWNNGAGDFKWNVLASSNWMGTLQEPEFKTELFANGDEVIFDGEGQGAITVVNGGVNPKSMVVNKGDYSFSGGSITVNKGVELNAGTTTFANALTANVLVNDASLKIAKDGSITGNVTTQGNKAVLTLADGVSIVGKLTTNGTIKFDEDAGVEITDAVLAGATLELNGNNTLTAGTLDFGSGVKLSYKISGANNDKLTLVAPDAVDLNGTTINIAFNEAPKDKSTTYTLIDGSSTAGLTGEATLAVSGVNLVEERSLQSKAFLYNLYEKDEKLMLDMLQANGNTSVTWTNESNNRLWNEAVAKNWDGEDTGYKTKVFLNGDDVFFDGKGTGEVKVADTGVNPKNMTVSDGDYRFTGGAVEVAQDLLLTGGKTTLANKLLSANNSIEVQNNAELVVERDAVLKGEVKTDDKGEVKIHLAGKIDGSLDLFGKDDSNSRKAATLTLANGATITGTLEASGNILFDNNAEVAINKANLAGAILTLDGENTLNVSNNLDLGTTGLTLAFDGDLKAKTSDKLTLKSPTVDLDAAKARIVFNMTPRAGGQHTFTLMQGTGLTGTGTLDTTQLTGFVGEKRRTGKADEFTYALRNDNGELLLDVYAGNINTTVTWTGEKSESWAFASDSAQNWTGQIITAGDTNTFINGDSVIFDAKGREKTVSADTKVIVNKMTVEGGDYQFKGEAIAANSLEVSGGSASFANALSISGDATVAANATLAFSENQKNIDGTLKVGGTLELSLGSTQPLVNVDALEIESNGLLSINGYSASKATRASEVSGEVTLLHSDQAIQDFAGKAIVDDSTLNLPDYLTAWAFLANNDKDINVRTGLTWYSQDATQKAHGTFTVNANENFEVDVLLADNTENKANGWDGKTLIKDSEGTLVLSKDNTYTGQTIINEGTLQLGNGGAEGMVSGEIVNNAKLVFDHNAIVEYKNAISGSGNIDKNNANTLILSGTSQNFEGKMTIAEGTLDLSGSLGGTITANGGATLALSGNAKTVSIVDGATLNLSGNAKTVDINSGATLNVIGQKAKIDEQLTSAGKLNFAEGAELNVGTAKLEGSSLTLNGNNKLTGNVDFGNGGSIFNFDVSAKAYDQLNLAGAAPAALGGSIINVNFDTLLNHSDNWKLITGSGVADTGKELKISGNVKPVTDRTGKADEFMFGLYLDKNDLNLAAVQANDKAEELVWKKKDQANARTWDQAISTNWEGTINNLTTFVFLNNDNVFFTGNDVGAVEVVSGGVKAGTMEVEKGDYQFGGGAIAADSLKVSGGTTSFANALSISGNATVDSGATLAFSGEKKTIGGKLEVADGATLALELNGDEPLVQAGSAEFNANSKLDITKYSAAAAGSAYNEGTNVQTVIATDSSVTFAGKATVMGQADVDFLSAYAFVEGKFLKVKTDLTWYSTDNNQQAHGDFTIASGEFTLNAVLKDTSSNSGNFRTGWDGTSLTKKGEGTLILTEDNEYTGLTKIEEGRLQLGNGGAKGSVKGNIEIAKDAHLDLNRNTDLTLNGVISGEGEINKDNTNTLTLTDDSSGFTGITNLNEGSIELSGKLGGTINASAGTELAISGSAGEVNAAGDAQILIDGSANSLNAKDQVLVDLNGTVAGVVNMSGSSTLNLNDGAVIGDALTANGATVNLLKGAQVSLAGMSFTNTVLKIAGNNTLDSSATIGFDSNTDLIFDMAGATTDVARLKIANAGLTSAGQEIAQDEVRVSNVGSLADGNYVLVDAGTNMVSDSGKLFVEGEYKDASQKRGEAQTLYGLLTDEGKSQLLLALVDGQEKSQDLTWTGADGKHWNSNEANWDGTVKGVEIDTFLDGDSVIFADYNGVNQRVNIDRDVKVKEMTVKGNYDFAGAAIEAGKVVVEAGGSLGLMVGNEAALKANSVELNNTTLDIAGYTAATMAEAAEQPAVLRKVIDADNLLDFSGKVTVAGQAEVDFLTARAVVEGNDVYVETNLSWWSTDPDPIHQAHGNFTIADGKSFDLNAVLSNNTGDNLAPGWDGKSLTKKGEGTLILSADNEYDGPTAIKEGTLQLGNGGTAGSLKGDIVNDAVLAVNRADDLTLGSNISGTGTLNKKGDGVLTLTGANEYSGDTFLAEGGLTIANTSVSRVLAAADTVLNIAAGAQQNAAVEANGAVVAVDGVLNGDLKAAQGAQVAINDTMKGTANIFDSQFDVAGTLHGALKANNAKVNIDGSVVGDVDAGASSQLNVAGLIDGNLNLLGSNAVTDLAGSVSGNVKVGDSATLNMAANSKIGNDLTLNAGSTLNSFETTSVDGNLVADDATINFYRTAATAPSSPFMKVGGDADFGSSQINVGITGNEPLLNAGTTLVLAETAGDLTAFQGMSDGLTLQGMQGVSLVYDFALRSQGKQLLAEVVSGSVHSQTKSFSEGFISGMITLNQGAELASQEGMMQAILAARAHNGIQVFATASGNDTRYKTGSHVDVSGVNAISGVSFNHNEFILGGFVEFGNSSYDTHNSFSNSGAVDGDGKSDYFGGGLLARVDFGDTEQSHLYGEVTARGGRVSTDYASSDMVGPLGQKLNTNFDSKAMYYGASLAAGWLWQITDKAKADFYGRYLMTHQEGDSVKLNTGETLKFASVDSNRVRIGARLTNSFKPTLSAYVGAAYEYEFGGEAKATVGGYRIATPSLDGGTTIGEAGLTILLLGERNDFVIDVGVKGFAGQREGFSGTLQLKYGF